MQQFGGKDSKRHFTVVMGGKEHGLYVSSTPSSAARKAVTKLCTANKSKKVEFSIREITQGSKKKTYGPYSGYIEKLKEPIELKGRVIKYKPVAKLSGKKGVQKGGNIKEITEEFTEIQKLNSKYSRPPKVNNNNNNVTSSKMILKRIDLRLSLLSQKIDKLISDSKNEEEIRELNEIKQEIMQFNKGRSEYFENARKKGLEKKSALNNLLKKLPSRPSNGNLNRF